MSIYALETTDLIRQVNREISEGCKLEKYSELTQFAESESLKDADKKVDQNCKH